MGACSSNSKDDMMKTNDISSNPWEIMIQSHQALYSLLDHVKHVTETGERSNMESIRKEADFLFLLMKLHAKIEDAVYFPAFHFYRPNIANSFSDDHKRSDENRPKLLELLNNAAHSDEAFKEGMEALKNFCEGNRTHQENEEIVLDPFKPLFRPSAAKDLFLKIAMVDFDSFKTTYVPGIYENIPTNEGKQKFLSALEYVLSGQQYADVKSHLQPVTQNSDFDRPMSVPRPVSQPVHVSITPVPMNDGESVKAWEIMIQSHQGLYKALDEMKLMTETMTKDSMAEIRKTADHLFLLMKLHARIEDAVYFPAFNAFEADIASKFSDDHNRSAEGRPTLLGLLDHASESDEAFQAAMTALKNFCVGNRNHQEKEEEVLNPLKPKFESHEVKELFVKIVELDVQSFNEVYVPGICGHLPVEGKEKFLGALKEIVSDDKHAEMIKNVV